ncbi:lactonase family protein [Stutzerimonas tarimensis]|uniref:Lactonase family protein n=1 Tax=Stutzerimonas tarimensis TaxID=1507735 RepID=A0ABV7T5J0_9GAMM
MNPSTHALLAVGTYTESMADSEGQPGAGIHLLRLDLASGELSEAVVHSGPVNPTYLTSALDKLYSIREVGRDASPSLDVFALDRAAATLTPLSSLSTPGSGPCHVSVDSLRSLVLVSNYNSGEVLAYSLDPDGLPWDEPVVMTRSGSGPDSERQDGPHAHCARTSPDGHFVYLCDLGTDKVMRHPVIDGRVRTSADLTLAARPGAGPRHLDFTPSGRHLLVNNELASSLSLYRLSGDEVALVQELSTLSGEVEGNKVAALCIHPSGRFVYVSNRGEDSVFAARLDEAAGSLTRLGSWKAGGRTPRGMAVSPDGRFLLVASQDDGLIQVFRIEPDDGGLQPLETRYPIDSAVCLHFT